MVRADLAAIAALRYLQFPRRYFMVVPVGTAALAALVLSSIKNRTAQALVVVVIGLQYWQHHDQLEAAGYFPRQIMNIDNGDGCEAQVDGRQRPGLHRARGSRPRARANLRCLTSDAGSPCSKCEAEVRPSVKPTIGCSSRSHAAYRTAHGFGSTRNDCQTDRVQAIRN